MQYFTEICNRCGLSVEMKSGLFVNRVIDANDYWGRVANGAKYPEGDFICATCDASLKNDKSWFYSARAWQAKIGVHEPHICEISPFQYHGMSKRSRTKYDAQRKIDWDQSAAAKQSWAMVCYKAYLNDEFTFADVGLHDDAKAAVLALLQAEEKKQKAEALEKAIEANRQIQMAEIKVGQRLWHNFIQRYGKVVRKFRVSVQLEFDQPIYRDVKVIKANVGILCLKNPRELEN